MSPQMLQQIAMHAKTDMAKVRLEDRHLSDINVLAGLGTNGTYQSNINSELRAKLQSVRISEPLQT